MKTIIHLDMDAFYASVEQRDAPALKGKPVIVGGHPTRGVVLAASYEARPFGVRSAIPMARALKLAPHAIVVPPRFSAYVQASEAVFAILESVTPLIEPLSLDEAFLDVTGSFSLFGDGATIASQLRQRIRIEVGLPASAGIAEVKFAAKIASDVAKPDGQRVVPVGQTKAFLAPLPVSRLWGVGPKTEEQLLRLGLKTIGDVAARPLERLVRELGSAGRHLWELAQGRDDRAVVPDRDAKSIGARDTFDEDLTTVEKLAPHIHSQALRVARRVRKAQVKARVVQLALTYGDFQRLTRQTTLDSPTDDGQTIYRAALALLESLEVSTKAVRLTGVSVSDLSRGEAQLGLFAPSGPNRTDKLNKALDAISNRFGSKAVAPADVLADTEDEERVEMRRQLGARRADAPEDS
jgi:DNA polymerase IV